MCSVLPKDTSSSITLLDWQLSRVSSPAMDISLFLFSSTNKSLRDKHLDEFLQIYYASFASILQTLGSDPDVLYPEAELQRQLRQFGIHGVTQSPVLVPLIIADSSECPNYDDLAENMSEGAIDTGSMKHLNGAKVKEFGQRMNDMLDDARRYGWLEQKGI